MVDFTADNAITATEVIKQNLYYSVLKQLSGKDFFTSWIPSYGNYNGVNADVNAWTKWQAYVEVYKPNMVITRDAAGAQLIRDLLAEYTTLHPNSDPLNLKPKDAQDVAGFNHDISLFGGSLTYLVADVKFAIESFTAFVTDQALYSVIAAPFVGIVGATAHAVSGA